MDSTLAPASTSSADTRQWLEGRNSAQKPEAKMDYTKARETLERKLAAQLEDVRRTKSMIRKLKGLEKLEAALKPFADNPDTGA